MHIHIQMKVFSLPQRWYL